MNVKLQGPWHPELDLDTLNWTLTPWTGPWHPELEMRPFREALDSNPVIADDWKAGSKFFFRLGTISLNALDWGRGDWFFLWFFLKSWSVFLFFETVVVNEYPLATSYEVSARTWGPSGYLTCCHEISSLFFWNTIKISWIFHSPMLVYLSVTVLCFSK